MQRERKGGNPRDPRVPAASEPTAQARISESEARGSSSGLRRRDAAAQVTEGGYGPYGRDRRDVSSSSRGPAPPLDRDASRAAAPSVAKSSRAEVGVDTADDPPAAPGPAGEAADERGRAARWRR